MWAFPPLDEARGPMLYGRAVNSKDEGVQTQTYIHVLGVRKSLHIAALSTQTGISERSGQLATSISSKPVGGPSSKTGRSLDLIDEGLTLSPFIPGTLSDSVCLYVASLR